MTVIDSDDNDVVESTPEKNRSKAVVNKCKNAVIISDSEEDSKQKKTSPNKTTDKHTSHLKPVNINDVFGKTPIKQSKVEIVPKINVDKSKLVEKKQKKNRKLKTEIGVHDDEDFEKTLLDLDDDVLLQNADILDKTIEEALQKNNVDDNNKSSKKTPKLENEKKRQRRSSAEGKSKRECLF